jgi:hypothetical protein
MAEGGGEPLPLVYKIFEGVSTAKSEALAPFAKARSKMNKKADSKYEDFQRGRAEHRVERGNRGDYEES